MKLGCSKVLFNQSDLYGTLQHLAWAGYEAFAYPLSKQMGIAAESIGYLTRCLQELK